MFREGTQKFAVEMIAKNNLLQKGKFTLHDVYLRHWLVKGYSELNTTMGGGLILSVCVSFSCLNKVGKGLNHYHP